MSDRPIQDFVYGCESFRADDLAVLMWVVGLQESRWPVSPSVADGKLFRFEDMTADEIRESFKRLLEAGEIVRVDGDGYRGFEVARFDELRDGMMDFGRRRYQRMASRKSREKRREVPA
jgi:hypothetical protein